MILSEKEYNEFIEVTTPLMKWLENNCHPHVTVIVTSTDAELLEGIACNVSDNENLE